MTTRLPGWASRLRGGMPMGLRMEALVASSSCSSGMCGGSGTVSPGMNTRVLSGSRAGIRPFPYSKSNFISVAPSRLYHHLIRSVTRLRRAIKSGAVISRGQGISHMTFSFTFVGLLVSTMIRWPR